LYRYNTAACSPSSYHQSSHAHAHQSHSSEGAAHAERQLLVKSYGRPPPGLAGFSRPQQQQQLQLAARGAPSGDGTHGLQLIRESLGSWTHGSGGGGDEEGGFADPRLAESLDEYTQSRDGLRRELAAMAGELSQERSVWSSHSRV
jgi:hypothetical protein